MVNIAKEDQCHCLHAGGQVKSYPPKAGSGVTNPKFAKEDQEASTKQGISCRSKGLFVFSSLAAGMIYWFFSSS
ncbi:hypothetical protein WICPIJ_009591 [Wickerhamomyces pijperi]|uniref:Uncharacterized protein n=1 Tax=Wickerhamomyces pijperi TaxID=599730 RepID=A0A9P8PLN4_WICPI|nr:hypothetical protein WICPIJ_009591 [Wickerhamomyces pijperi]